MSEPSSPPLWKKAVRFLLASLALLFIVFSLRDLTRNWDPSSVRLHVGFLLAAIPLGVLASFVQSEAWLRLLDAWTEHRIARRPGRALFFAAQLARYTPGKVGLPAMRLAYASSLGVRPAVMGSTLVLETMTWCVTGGAACAAVLLLYPEVLASLGMHLAFTSGMSSLALVCALLSLAVFLFVDRRRLPKKVLEKLQLSGAGPLIPSSVVGLYVVHWVAWIAHGALLGLALGAAPERMVLAGVSLVLGILAGFVAFLAPAGAGVREAVIAVVAAPVLGATAAMALGLLARGLSMGIDVALWLVTRALRDTKRAVDS